MKKVIAIGIGTGVVLLAVIGLVAATHTPGTVETARIAGDKARAIELSGRELGLTCIASSESCAELIVRAEKNSQLKAVFLKAKAADVGILPRSMLWPSVGHTGEGYVVVNTLYSDEKIIAFLTK